MSEKILVFDMDGTIADFYRQENWLYNIRHEIASPYSNAKPLFDMDTLNNLCISLKAKGYRIVITSWLSKESTTEFKNKVRIAKREWLEKYNFPCDEIHLVQYGTPKSSCTKKHKNAMQILVDDEEKNLSEFTRKAKHFGIKADENLICNLQNLLY